MFFFCSLFFIDNNKSSDSNSPKLNYPTNIVLNKSSNERIDSPSNCEIQPATSQLKNSVINQTIQYLNVANLTKNLSANQASTNKMSKSSQQTMINNENNINKHNINNNSISSRTIDKQQQILPQIVKFRRLLTSIYLHANDISNETGDHAHSLILGLIVS